MDKKRKILSPLRLFLIIMASVFVVEFFVMIILDTFMDELGYGSWVVALMDGLTLTIVLSPIIYFSSFRPLSVKIKQLAENEERFRSIFQGSGDAQMLLTEKGFFDCNPKTLEIFGFKNKEDLIKVHPADISPPNQPDGKNSREAAQQHIQKAFVEGSDDFEWVHRRSNGQDFPAEVLLTAFNLGGKKVLQATVRDISQKKETDKIEKEKIEEISKMNKLMMGRELRLMEMKQEIEDLKSRLKGTENK
jgi:PAS domain S-box-containing protein